MISQNEFSLFDPQAMDALLLPSKPGVCMVLLRNTSSLSIQAQISTTPILTPFEYKEDVFDVIYVGISNKNLRTRIYDQHFTGTGGTSTLRKSLGCLLGLKLIPRDINAPENGKTTFCDADEKILTEWMKTNLLLLYYTGNDYIDIEKDLIRTYNPPLNLQGNFNKKNSEFRKELSALRSNNSQLQNYQSETTPMPQQVRCRHCRRKLGIENLKTEAYYVCPKCGCSTPNPMYKPVKQDNKHSSWKSVFVIIGFVLLIGITIKNCDSDLFETSKENRIDNPVNNTYLDKSTAKVGVKQYLKYNYLKDPDSYEGINWAFGIYDCENNIYFVLHKFRAKNSFGGYVVDQKEFLLDSEGNVIDVIK